MLLVSVCRSAHSQNGVALALLLWMVAGLSLLVSSIISLSRSDVQLTALQLDQARVQAAATGAGHMLMRDMWLARQIESVNVGSQNHQAARPQDSGIFQREYRFDGMAIKARAIPISSLIGLNSATPELLAELFVTLGKLSVEDAHELSERMLLWRSANMSARHPGMPEATEAEFLEEKEEYGGFRVLEDLLRVPGMTRAIYDRISPAIHVLQNGSSGVDPRTAPAQVLFVLAGGDRSIVDFILESRQDVRAGAEVAMASLRPDLISAVGGQGSSYCLDIDVTIAGAQTYRQLIWVENGGSFVSVPWGYTRVQPVSGTLVPGGW